MLISRGSFTLGPHRERNNAKCDRRLANRDNRSVFRVRVDHSRRLESDTDRQCALTCEMFVGAVQRVCVSFESGIAK